MAYMVWGLRMTMHDKPPRGLLRHNVHYIQGFFSGDNKMAAVQIVFITVYPFSE
jgi:hypothetical protein